MLNMEDIADLASTYLFIVNVLTNQPLSCRLLFFGDIPVSIVFGDTLLPKCASRAWGTFRLLVQKTNHCIEPWYKYSRYEYWQLFTTY